MRTDEEHGDQEGSHTIGNCSRYYYYYYIMCVDCCALILESAAFLCRTPCDAQSEQRQP